mgnify:FL=1
MDSAKIVAISEELLKSFGSFGDSEIRAGFDKVFGEGAFEAFASDLYDDLNAA